jgi:threonine/homoserine/homoserine lactone efflux protein
LRLEFAPLLPSTTAQFAAGALLGLSLAAPPGPVIAVIAGASARGRTRESIATGLGAMTGDAVWLGLVVLGFIAFLKDHGRLIGLLGLAGGGLLLWMAWETWRAARRGIGESSTPGSYRLGFVTVLTSPYSFAWWMASGPILIRTLGGAGIAGLFLSILVYVVAFTYAMKWLGERVRHTAAAVAYVSVAILAVFGVLFALAAVRYLTGSAA